jgi:hypothetical protein
MGLLRLDARCAVAIALAVAACTGNIGDQPAAPQPETLRCEGGELTVTPLLRVTNAQYRSAIADLLGEDVTAQVDAFPVVADPAAAASFLLVEKLHAAAEDVARAVGARLDELLPCDPAAAGEEACAATFVHAFAERAFRRPLDDEERAWLERFYAEARAGRTFGEAIEMAIEVVVQSPQFLYRIEIGEAAEGLPEGVRRLTGFEVATRLSFLLWGTTPDDALLEAARQGELDAPAGVRAAAERLMADARARTATAELYRTWLRLDDLPALPKDPELYAAFTPELGGYMATETASFVEHVMWDEDGALDTLLTAPFTYANRSLALFYGAAEVPADDATWARVALDPAERAGLLTQASFLATFSHVAGNSPVHRGLFVRAQLFCEPLPPPPPNVDNTPQKPGPMETLRDRLAQHQSDPSCSACHELIDPIGFGFESYDAIGRFRSADENGFAVDASGSIKGTDVPGDFVGAVELAGRLAASDQVSACYARRFYTQAIGRAATAGDRCDLDALGEAFIAGGENLRELLVLLTETDGFRYVRKETP